MSGAMTHKTALCLIPPNSVCDQIQSIRSVHDKAYPRWMPHINLIYPFVTEANFSTIKSRLDAVLNSKAAFELEFDQSSFHYFKQSGGECTFHLRPKASKNAVELQQAIQSCLSGVVPASNRPFEAHLTLGQTATSRISDVLVEMKAKWKPIRFTIDRVCLISRENDPEDLFSVKSQVLFVGGKKEEEEAAAAAAEDEELQRQHTLPPAICEGTTPGLRALPTTFSLCIVPPSEFSSRLLRLFEDTSFRPLHPFRITLADYESKPLENELRARVEAIAKLTLNFGARSICFNYSTARLFLKPVDTEPIQRLNLNNDPKFDGTLTLGDLDKNDLTEVANRYTENWTFQTNEFEVDRVHLLDSNGRFQYAFQLRSQCFS